METATRRMRFRQRIEVERKVLSEVNNLLPVSLPLSGITETTVNRWGDSLKLQIGTSAAENIKRLVMEIARRLSFDADCSRDVFEGEELVAVKSTDDLLSLLREALKSIDKN